MKQIQRNALYSDHYSKMNPEERRRLQKNIQQWNSNRLSLFEITEPDEDSVFHGVIRFHLQDHISGNCATKCICISSVSTTQEVIETLVEKFQHDGTSLPFSYSLYEVLKNQEERKLDLSEKPLVVQLNWNKDTDGRFVLRNDGCVTLHDGCVENKEKVGVIEHFKRTLSKKEKKSKKTKNVSSSHSVSDSKANRLTQDYLEVNWNLPLSISLKEKDEESFLLAVINDINSSTIHFKLSPAYVFYLVGRFLTSHKPLQSEQKVCEIFDKIVHLIQGVIQKQRNIAVALAFWMANTSELLNFIRRDRDLCAITLQAQNTLTQLVQQAFRYLSHRLQVDLENQLPAFFADVKKEMAQEKEIEGVLNTFMKTMSLLRRCRVNPALSIQLFSQLFHFMGAWILNRLTVPGSRLCSNYWGKTLQQRLMHVEAWAERQGLELAVDCHLSRIIQATMLLTMTSSSTRDAQVIQSTCYKLNSLQLRALMSKHPYSPNQPHFSAALIERVAALAENTTDVLRGEGGEIRLEEELDLHLPFLLPEDGYSSDSMRGIPKGFQEFLEPICRKGLCKLIPHSNCVGTWTIFFIQSDHSPKGSTWKPEPMKITLKKPLHGGMGVSIVAAKRAGQDKLGIFIKSVVQGGAANEDGRLNPGDQLLSVDGKSLVGVSQERAAEVMMHTGSVVSLEIVKSAAVYYGFEGVFTQSPQTTCKDHDNCGPSKQKSSVSDLNDSAEASVSGPSRPLETFRNQHTISRVNTKQNQKWLRQKLDYRSNPNLAYNQEMPVDSVAPEKKTLSFSIENLTDSGKQRNTLSNAETFHREYLTLPTSKPHGNKTTKTTEHPPRIAPFSRDLQKSNFMKQALSQDNLWSEEKGGPLVGRPRYLKKQSDLSKWNSIATISPMDSSLSSLGLWKIPTTAQSVPLSQPKRMDVPYTPPNSLSFSTFRQPEETQMMSPAHHRHQSNASPSQRPQQACKKKTVVFQSTVQALQNNSASRLSANPHHKGPDKIKKLSVGDSWKRDAQDKQQTADLLQQEVQQLQTKVQHSIEESERLRRLSLELQFQKRLEEFQQNGEEDDDYDSDSGTGQKWFQTGSDVVNCENTETPAYQQKESHFTKEAGLKDGVKCESTGYDKTSSEKLCSGEVDHKSFKTRRSPENLSFKERQQLFSLAMVTSSKVKVS
ncbi:afadin isoform X2 [Carassius carassius]|uniref:afadin isoform X2 n=1 Tax=Carassius carassius TaxID=217509 RepID=UPI002868771B|nr:afadin isoform X2 [Carassius carassius]